MTVVSKESAEEPYKHRAKEVKFFALYDHKRIAKPTDANDPVYVWVKDILRRERTRLDAWHERKLCLNNC
jgi:hypothetical protein